MFKPLPPRIQDLVRESAPYRAAFDCAVEAANITVAGCQFLDTADEVVQAMREEGGFSGIAARAVEHALKKVPGCFEQLGNPPVTSNVARVLRSDTSRVADAVRARWVNP